MKTIFIHGIFDEEIYMEQLSSFVAQGESEQICHLKESLYGLK